MTEQAVVKEMPKRSVTIHPSRVRLAEYERQSWVANAEYGTTVEDLTGAAYWSHVAAQMKPYDHIEVRSEDGAWVADLVVVQVDRNWAKVAVKAVYELVAKEVPPSLVARHKVEWKGPQHKFSVIRLSDSQMIRNEFATRDEANQWLREFEKTA